MLNVIQWGAFFRVGSFVVLMLAGGLVLPGCALYDALSGDSPEDAADVSGGDVSGGDVSGGDVGSGVDGGGDVSGGDVGSGGDVSGGDVGSGVDGGGDVSDGDVEEERVCALRCMGGCSGSDENDCNDVAVSIAVGHHHACAVSSKGSVYCWGSNSHGQLGREVGTGASSFHRAARVEGLSNVTSVVAGKSHTCAMRFNESLTVDEVRCWGSNQYGQITGYKNAEDEGPGVFDEPTLVPLLSEKVKSIKSISAGSDYTCAHIVSAGSGEDDGVTCWGYWSSGIYVNRGGKNTEEFEPFIHSLDPGGNEVGFLIPTAMSSSQYENACVIGNVKAVSGAGPDYGEAVWCWGGGDYGQQDSECFYNDDESNSIYLVSRGLAVDVSSQSIVSTGLTHTCFMQGSTDKVQCWGWMFTQIDKVLNGGDCEFKSLGLLYQEGNPGGSDAAISEKEVCELSFEENVVDVISGDRIVCMQLASGKLRCMGVEAKGEDLAGVRCRNLEENKDEDVVLNKVDLNSQGTHTIVEFRIGRGFACALLEDKTVRCWGEHEITGPEDPIAHWTGWSDESLLEIQFD